MSDIIEIDLAGSLYDSTLNSYYFSTEHRRLTIIVTMWNTRRLEITFDNPQLFLDNGNELFKFFCENRERSSLFFETMNRVYEKIPEEIPYKLFQIINIDDEPSLEIIAEDFKSRILHA